MEWHYKMRIVHDAAVTLVGLEEKCDFILRHT